MEATARGDVVVEVDVDRWGWDEVGEKQRCVEVEWRRDEVRWLGWEAEGIEALVQVPIRLAQQCSDVWHELDFSDKTPSKLYCLKKFGNHHVTTKLISLKKI